MYAEITKEMFHNTVADDTEFTRIEELELARKMYYKAFDMQLLKISNYVSNVEQYYILDIND